MNTVLSLLFTHLSAIMTCKNQQERGGCKYGFQSYSERSGYPILDRTKIFMKWNPFWPILGTFSGTSANKVQKTWSVQGTRPVLSCKEYATIMSITQFFHLWHNSKGYIFVTLTVSSQIYPPEDDVLAKRCDTTMWHIWRRFQKFNWRGSCFWGKIGLAPYFEGTKKKFFEGKLII